MQMVVYTRVNGVDLPLAIAEAHPGRTTSNAVVWRWNREDPYAKRVVQDLRDDPGWLDTHQLWAVSAGMAVPPEWASAYKD